MSVAKIDLEDCVFYCTIFETLNRTGVKLTVFDLLTARFWPLNIRLRDLWEQAQTDYPILSEFGIDPYYVLQAVAIYKPRTAAPTCKRSDVLQIEVKQIKEGWEPVVKGLGSVLRILREDCGVILPQWLPYMTMLVPMAATMAAAGSITGDR